MNRPLKSLLRRGVALAVACGLVAVVAPSASGALAAASRSPSPVAAATPPVPVLDWSGCGGGFECARAEVPFDYEQLDGRTFDLALIRKPASDQANRIGSLFLNPGGPGGSAFDFVRTAPPDVFALLSRFDVVGVDNRGYARSGPTLDCAVDQESLGLLAQPFAEPLTVDAGALVDRTRSYVEACFERNAGILPHLNSGNLARDLDLMRAAMGDDQLNYIGISYGSVIGATYASLFPGRVRAMVLDAPIDVDTWLNDPLEAAREEAAGFEGSLDRFFGSCAANQDTCGFGGTDPEVAFDALVERLDREPLASSDPTDPRPVDGDDVRMAAAGAMYGPSAWPSLASALVEAEAGDGTAMRALTDGYYGRFPDGSYSPSYDYYAAVTALDQDFPAGVSPYLDAGRHAYSLADNFWTNFNAGYTNLVGGLWPVEGHGVFRGPIEHSAGSPPVVVFGTTYDAVTPFVWAERLVADLGNARLVTYRGDGHGSLTSLDACLIGPMLSYVIDLAVPPEGLVCDQQFEPFAAGAPSASAGPAWALPNRTL